MPSLIYTLALASLLGLIVGFLSVTAVLPEPPHEGIEISQAEYGDQWPFAIQQGRLRCEGTGAVIFTARGKDYGVNGMAGSRYASIEPVRKSTGDPSINIGSIISRGLTLCNWSYGQDRN
jgi:uncharacterized protein DUF2511